MPKNALRVAPLETADYVLSALELPGGESKVMVVGDCIEFQFNVENYNEAKRLILHAGKHIDDHDFQERARWFWKQFSRQLRATPPQCVVLADYETDNDLRFLKPEDDWGLVCQKIQVEETAVLLRKKGVEVQLRMLKLSDYMDWLVKNNLENNPVIRAQFVAGKP